VPDLTLNDNYSARPGTVPREPDPYGQAAMLLVESLIHGLLARSLLTVADAVEIVEVAAEVKEEIGPSLGDSPVTLQKSIDLLDSIRRSLEFDLPNR
jgi:hypothetical protein